MTVVIGVISGLPKIHVNLFGLKLFEKSRIIDRSIVIIERYFLRPDMLSYMVITKYTQDYTYTITSCTTIADKLIIERSNFACLRSLVQYYPHALGEPTNSRTLCICNATVSFFLNLLYFLCSLKRHLIAPATCVLVNKDNICYRRYIAGTWKKTLSMTGIAEL